MTVPFQEGWHYLEHLGDLYAGFSRSWPQVVWDFNRKEWRDYPHKDRFKPVEWGTIISRAEAEELMDL